MQDVVRRSSTLQQAAVEPAGLNRQQHCNRQYSNRPYENSDVTAVYGTVYSCDATGCAETEISSKHKAYFAWRTEVGGRAVQQLDGETMVFDCPDPRTLSLQTTRRCDLSTHTTELPESAREAPCYTSRAEKLGENGNEGRPVF